mmetsp:Transcript_19293/g.39281  ORF Transcript_19293/g.39281 Transcript_19293/m.39281 type:complete len:275 (+) Transcript_19293:62-886(+)
MNGLLHLDFQYEKKKIFIEKRERGKFFETFFSKNLTRNQLKTQFSFGFPGYPVIKPRGNTGQSQFSEENNLNGIEVELWKRKEWNSLNSEHLFFLGFQENFFLIYQISHKKIKETNKSMRIKNPYNLFSFRNYMNIRFIECKDEFSKKEMEKKFEIDSFFDIIFYFFEILRKKTLEKNQKIYFTGQVLSFFFLALFVFSSVNLSNFFLVNLWNIVFPFALYRFLFKKILGIHKKFEKILVFNRIGIKFDEIYKKFVIFVIFLNGLFRTSNILSV